MALPAIPNKNVQIRRYPIASGETPEEGGLVYLVAGEITVCGADPALIAGIYMSVLTADMDFDPYEGDGLVALAYSGSTFLMSGTSNPTAANIGEDYGVSYDANERVQVDITDTTAVRVNVEAIDTTRNLFEVSFLSANRQLEN